MRSRTELEQFLNFFLPIFVQFNHIMLLIDESYSQNLKRH